ncbi:MAG: transposase family protein, partial [Desulfobacteraceae bacterium]|nr:transposase family protein [Desulfobacteraceae bacterium]
DDYSDFFLELFPKKKSELKDYIIHLIKELKTKYSILVKIIGLDNSGENNALEKLCKQEGLGIKFKYTAPGTPQQNGQVERKFQTLYGRLRLSLLGSGVKGAFKKRLWAGGSQYSN